MKKSLAPYPTLVEGTIEGPIRCESLDGDELWLPPREGVIRDLKPFDFNGKTYAVTHLQKKAKSFSLLFDPFIYHYGKFWKLQQQDDQGNWIPGTEKGIYTRTPGWRFDFAGTNGEHWIFTKGYFGFHLD